MANTQKLYCYVDETGQDVGSAFFIVVCVLSSQEQQAIRQNLVNIEQTTGVGIKKWHISRSPEKEEFMRNIIREGLAKGDIYYSVKRKPLSFFYVMLETIEKAIKNKCQDQGYKAIIYVDGIDYKKAIELTRILRIRGIRLKLARSVHDESEVMIRLADRWAGCIRGAMEGKVDNKNILTSAIKANYIKNI